MEGWGRLILILLLILSGDLMSMPPEPEAPTGFRTHPVAVGHKTIVSTANSKATEAADWALVQGGSAVDAAITAQMVLTLTEPQSSGIGGGLFLVFWDAKAKQMLTLDGRETAPLLATADLFVDNSGQPVGWIKAMVGGRAVGVPGVVAALYEAHQKYGRLPWQRLFEPAIELAEKGFVVSPRLEGLLVRELNPGLKRPGIARDYFYPDDKPLKAGELKRNPELADTLRRIAKLGPDGFYQGKIAKKIVDSVANDPSWPGKLTLQDLKEYRPFWREPVCTAYRVYQICGMGPPSSGAVTVGQILGLLAQQDIGAMTPNSTEFIHYFSQASRLAYADRNHYLADSDFIDVPVEALLDRTYLNQRSKWIKPERDGGKAKAGPLQIKRGRDAAAELPSTTHIAIVDSDGNVLSMTSSIEMGFGSSIMVAGFLLNNQLTDFSFQSEREGLLVANRVESGKRPRSSMAPTIVLNEHNQPILALGSPGGSRIISYVAHALVAILDWEMPLDKVMSLPRISHRNDYLALEKEQDFSRQQADLERMGYQIQRRALNSGIQAIMRIDKHWIGAADPRREGLAVGH